MLIRPLFFYPPLIWPISIYRYIHTIHWEMIVFFGRYLSKIDIAKKMQLWIICSTIHFNEIPLKNTNNWKCITVSITILNTGCGSRSRECWARVTLFCKRHLFTEFIITCEYQPIIILLLFLANPLFTLLLAFHLLLFSIYIFVSFQFYPQILISIDKFGVLSSNWIDFVW